MSHSYVSNLVHGVFSTKERRQQIVPEIRQRLWAYTGGVARENGMQALAVGGADDHAHILLALPATLAVAKAMQLVKGASSKWVHDTFPSSRGFAWQEGYGAFSIGISQVQKTVAYIESQEEHHRKTTFQEEYLAILKKHGFEFDPRYVWG